MHNLLRKSTLFKFNENCQIAFESLKKELTSYPTLTIYNPFLDTDIHTDASALAVAGILLQKQKSGRLWHIIVRLLIKQKPNITVSSWKCSL